MDRHDDHMIAEDAVLAIARPTVARRLLAVGTLAGLGAVTLYLALTQSTQVYGSGLLMVTGLVSLSVAEVIRRSTNSAVELTQTALRDSDGTVIAATADVVNVDRGSFRSNRPMVLSCRQPSRSGGDGGLECGGALDARSVLEE